VNYEKKTKNVIFMKHRVCVRCTCSFHCYSTVAYKDCIVLHCSQIAKFVTVICFLQN